MGRSPGMSKSERDRALVLAVVGAMSGVAGERLLGLLPPPFIAFAVVAAVGGLIWFVRKRTTEGGDTVGQAVAVALISAVATFGATRLYQRSPLLLLEAIVVTLVVGVLVVRWARVKTEAVHPTTATPRRES